MLLVRVTLPILARLRDKFLSYGKSKPASATVKNEDCRHWGKEQGQQGLPLVKGNLTLLLRRTLMPVTP